MKLISILVVTAISYAWWAVRRRRARARLREIDAGQRCISCDGTEMQQDAGNTRCLRCGYVASLAGLRSVALSDQEIANMTRPDDQRL